MSDQHFSKFIYLIGLLINNQSLPPEALDHPLIGNWQHFREFHISGDLLVIYQQTAENELLLVRIGTHSQLFS